MPNKRFLGLGFSFTANDKGLEKKLLGIKSALSGIGESLVDIGMAGDVASASIGKIKKPRGGTRYAGPARPTGSVRGSSHKETRSTARAPSRFEGAKVRFLKEIATNTAKMVRGVGGPAGAKSQKTRSEAPHDDKVSGKGRPLQEVFKDLSAGSKEFVKQIQDALGGDAGKQFRAQLEKFKIDMDGAGNVTLESRTAIGYLAKGMAENLKAVEKWKKKFKTMKDVLGSVSSWMGKVAGSAHNFLQSVGVDLKSMIPDQFKALFGLLSSALMGPIKVASSVWQSLRKNSEAKKNNEAQIAALSKVARLIGENPSDPHTVIGALIADRQKGSGDSGDKAGDKSGVFSQLWNSLTGIKYIGPVLSMLGSAAVLLAPLIPILIGLGAAAAALYAVWKLAPKEVESVYDGLKHAWKDLTGQKDDVPAHATRTKEQRDIDEKKLMTPATPSLGNPFLDAFNIPRMLEMKARTIGAIAGRAGDWLNDSHNESLKTKPVTMAFADFLKDSPNFLDPNQKTTENLAAQQASIDSDRRALLDKAATPAQDANNDALNNTMKEGFGKVVAELQKDKPMVITGKLKTSDSGLSYLEALWNGM